jgi:mono/diheme cytochrome c family protein
MSQKRYNIFGITLLLLLAGFTLAAGNAIDIPLPATGDESGGSIAAPQSAMPQDFNLDTQNVSADWDAAAFFAASCASCHGSSGGGTAFAPALNTEAIQTADLDWLIETISYGRTGTAMPAWSIEFGGPLTSDQIAAMAAFLQAGDDWKEAGAIAAEQSIAPTGPGMMGNGGMMGRGMNGNGMMGRGMGNGRMP